MKAERDRLRDELDEWIRRCQDREERLLSMRLDRDEAIAERDQIRAALAAVTQLNASRERELEAERDELRADIEEIGRLFGHLYSVRAILVRRGLGGDQ